MKDFTAIISTCKFGNLSISEANKMINSLFETSKNEDGDWKTERPKESVVALCQGKAYDACFHEDEQYFIAEYMAQFSDPQWVYGKQQNECEVFKWKNLKSCI